MSCDVRPGEALAAAIAAAAMAIATGRTFRRALCLLAAGAALCAFSANVRNRAVEPPLLAWFNDVTRQGDRTEEPVLIHGALAADATLAPAGCRLVIDVMAVQWDGEWRHASGRLQAFVSGQLASGSVLDWRKGRSLRAPVSLRRPQMAVNFGGPSLRRQILRRPFVLTGSIKSASLIEVQRGNWWQEAAAAIRYRVRTASAVGIAPWSRDAAAITTAILIGDRAGLSEDVERRLQMAGTYHVIAISGGNVALVAAISFVILRALFRSARAVAAATLIAVVVYGGIADGDASVARAVTAAVLYLALGMLGLRPTPFAVLRATAVVLLVLDPLMIIDSGAWLSFGATLGIVTFGPRWSRVLPRPGRHAPYAVARWAGLLALASIAAEIVLLPIAAATFSQVSIAGILLNLIAIPAMAFVQVGGLLVVCLQSVFPDLSAIAAAMVSAAASALLTSCALVDGWPWLSWRVPPTHLGWTVAYYAAVACATVCHSRHWRRAGITGAIVALSVILSAPLVTAAQPIAQRLRLVVVDVGQGEAVVVQMPGGRALLVDAGGTPGPFDIGGRVVTPALWALGIRRLDWLAVSHGDRDHAGGVPSVVRDLAPREIWEGVPVPADVGRQQLRSLVAARAIAWRTILAGGRLELGDVVIEALHPPPPEWERQKVRNDDSMVLRINYQGVELWLTGDAGLEFERTLPPPVPSPRLRILKVGHHGSRTATAGAFLESLKPQIALISAGRGNLFGHPSREVVSRLERAGAAIFRTDEDGGIVVETDGLRARVSTARGKTWSFALAGQARPPGS